MPHVVVEYSDNLAAEGDIPGLLKAMGAKLNDSGGIIPIGGIRIRAVRMTETFVADGQDDYAFLHITVKLGKGRTEEFKTRFFGEVFEIVKAHFADLFERRYLALSMYLEEVDEGTSFKHNNIHKKFRA